MKKGSNYPVLISELKKILKRKKINYLDLAIKLEMSESSIKRLMNAADAPLSKIEAICEIADVNLFDLVSICQKQHDPNYYLSPTQEKFFLRNSSYFFFLVELYENQKSVKQIKKEYRLTLKTINLYLKKLEELGFLERHPGDRIVWKFSGDISVKNEYGFSKHLLNISVSNFADTIKDLDNLQKLMKKKSAFFQFSDLYYLRDETAKDFFKKFEMLHKEMAIASEQESKIFGIKELTKHSLVNAILPMSLYYEDIPNL